MRKEARVERRTRLFESMMFTSGEMRRWTRDAEGKFSAHPGQAVRIKHNAMHGTIVGQHGSTPGYYTVKFPTGDRRVFHLSEMEPRG